MESWPEAVAEVEFEASAIAEHLGRVQSMLGERGIDALFVTSADRWLNEYTPRDDNHRYWLSGFTGSTAYLLVPAEGRAKLFVDGRYHIQADQEADASIIEVVKVPFGTLLQTAALDAVDGVECLAWESDRVSRAMEDALRERAESAQPLSSGEVAAALARDGSAPQKPLGYIPEEVSGRTTVDKLAAVFQGVPDPEVTLLLVPALDDIAWLTDARGYHFAYQSSFAATAFATCEAVHVCVEGGVADQLDARDGVVWHADPPAVVLASSDFDGIREVWYDASQTTAAFVQAVVDVRPDCKLVKKPSAVVKAKAVKTAAEIAHLESANVRSCRAITNAHKWVRERVAAKERYTELDFYEAANRFYSEEGARDLSFHTIAAFGANSAIIHFSDPSAEVVGSPDDLVLLDSGALYEGGLATDITRTFLAGGRRGTASDRQKLVYTLVMKGVLNAMHARFPAGTKGAFLDALARAPIYEFGMDYAHGTGHGVGVHVHEPGVGLSPTSALSIEAGHVSSIEPGVYLEGFGGVRIENVVTYVEDEEHEGFLRARPISWVGLDDHLVDRAIMTPTEIGHYEAWQAECERRGTLDFEAD